MNKNNDFDDIEFIDMGNNDNNAIQNIPDAQEPVYPNEPVYSDEPVYSNEPVYSDEPTFYVDWDEPEEEPGEEPTGKSIRPHKNKSTMSRAERRRRRRRKVMIRRAVFCVALIVFLISGTMLVKSLLDYRKGDKIYSDVEQSVFAEDTKKPTTADKNNTNTTDTTTAAGPESVLLTNYNHQALLDLNQDAVGYLQIPALNVLLPVVQGTDNDYYLHHTITGESAKNGTLFIDSRNADGIESQNAIIYGHNMKNGSMFGLLNRYEKADFFTTGDNKYFYFYIEDKIYKYEIYSVHKTPAISSTYTTVFNNSDAFFTYINSMIQASAHQNSVDIFSDSKTVTLSTCTSNDDVRLVVQAVRVDVITQ